MAAITDLFTATENGGAPQPTTCATARVSGATTLECEAITNWPTTGATGANTAVYFITAPTTANSAGLTVLDNTKLMSWKGIVSGNELTDITLIWSAAGDDIGNSVGDIVQMAPTSSWAQGLFSGLTTTVFNTDGSLQDNIIGTDQIQSGAVTTDTLAASAVTAANIDLPSFFGNSADANGWTLFNFFGKMAWYKNSTFTASMVTGPSTTSGTLSVPVAIASKITSSMVCSVSVGSSQYSMFNIYLTAVGATSGLNWTGIWLWPGGNSGNLTVAYSLMIIDFGTPYST